MLETIQFEGDTLYAGRTEDGTPVVAIKPICESMGIDPWRQQQKIQTDPKFNYRHMSVVAADGKNRDMLCILVSQLNGWLFTINANKVKLEVKEKLLAYQARCMDALFHHFMPQGGTIDEVQMSMAALLTEQGSVMSRHSQLLAVMNDRQQVHESRLNALEGRLDPLQKAWGSTAGQNLAAYKNSKN